MKGRKHQAGLLNNLIITKTKEEVIMGALIGIVVLVLDIVAIVDAVKSSMDTGKKALWILLVLILPVIGMVLYFLIGKKK
jgi:uncharacterized membrane protein YhaH (DUF805 family)